MHTASKKYAVRGIYQEVKHSKAQSSIAKQKKREYVLPEKKRRRCVSWKAIT
jgi:hypothetical protein